LRFSDLEAADEKNPETAFQPSHIQDIDQDVAGCISREVTVQPQEHEPPELSHNAIDYWDPLPAVLAPADSSAAKLARSFTRSLPSRVELSRESLRFPAPSVLVGHKLNVGTG
jgi:hypothetical protein